MKQSLQLRLGQQITMTPQLQQAIRLLQLSTLELQVEIQQALESNIMLEVADNEYDDNEYEEPGDTLAEKLAEDGYNGEAQEALNTTDSEEINLDSLASIPNELPTDSEWEDTFEAYNYQEYPSASSHDSDDKKDFENQGSTEESLQDYLLWQLGLSPFTDIDRAIAVAIIDAIEDDGYLRLPLEDIARSLGEQVEVSLDDIKIVLRRIQHFDPVGVASRNVSECLLLQLNELPAKTPWLLEARKLVKDHLDLLASKDYVQLGKRLKVERNQLSEVIELVQSLNPRPGAHLALHRPTYVVPDVFVRKVKGQWKVELNGELSPRLRINSHYANLINSAGRGEKKEDINSLKNHLQEARWFIKSLKSRHETLLKVANCIVRCQANFLDYGEEAMKPLVLHDVASELEMHESTISRVTTQKYIHTPRGIFELKYFFSSHVNTNNGGECSSTAIRALIKRLIATENHLKPLSDSKIAKILSERGINVARRTVAKYREAMVIPPSNERKRLA